MIGFFTDPFPDELLYSACARYHRKARNPSKRITSRNLFGKSTIKIVVDFPTCLGFLAAQLPFRTYSVDLLIYKHTLLPLFLAFTPAQRAAQIRRDMEGEGGGKIFGKIGILTSRIKVPNLRFCGGCAADDQVNYGQPYWHRVHQVRGVEVCAIHSVNLSESDIPVRAIGSHQELITAKQAITDLSPDRKIPSPINTKDHKVSILLQLANSAASLLQTRFESDPELVRRRYLNLLFEHGLSILNGNVNQSRLTTQFLDYYSSDLLALLGCEITKTSNWLSRIIQAGQSISHPLHHLLLMNFLGSTPEQFFQLPVEKRPFGRGPWPCLNRAVDHFHAARISKCQMKKEQCSPRITGTFTCDCGFSYRRTGFDNAKSRRFEYDRIMGFGNAWYEKLQALLFAGYSRKQMAPILGVCKNTLIREIRRIERAQLSNSSIVPRFATRIIDSSKSQAHFRARYREEWTNTLAAHDPTAGRTAMRSKAQAAYSWLVIHDRKWLLDHQPPIKSMTSAKQKKDWSTLDLAYVIKVHRSAEEIRNAPGPPVRIAQSFIAKALGIHGAVFKSQNLPKTKAALREVSDTNVSFALRRIQCARDLFLREPSTPSMWNQWSWRHLSRDLAANDLVKAEWERCLKTLENHYGTS